VQERELAGFAMKDGIPVTAVFSDGSRAVSVDGITWTAQPPAAPVQELGARVDAVVAKIKAGIAEKPTALNSYGLKMWGSVRDDLLALAAAPVQETVAWLEILRNNRTATDEVIGAFLRGHAEHLTGETFVLTTPPAAPVHDENQAFIDSLPTDSDDKMYMQIHHWARQSYARHKSLVAGQMITAGDASDTHIIWATLRWAKENTPPAPAPVPLTDEQKRDLIKKSALWDMHIHIGWYSAPAKSFVEKTIQLIADIEAAHGITEKGD
jgi:hypothetical protein